MVKKQFNTRGGKKAVVGKLQRGKPIMKKGAPGQAKLRVKSASELGIEARKLGA
jgi:hypothetical protein